MDYKVLGKINNTGDVKQLDRQEREILAKEIRHFLVSKVSRTGGHLASNLGVVELTIALHCCLDLPKDKIIWDVGHQSYVHKILTGRKDAFDTLRQSGGLSGFPKSRESDCDVFNTGHSSTSLSAALGMATAAKLKGDDSVIAAVIGDGSMTGGLSFEALDNLGKLHRNLLIILNDNKMSISKNVGGFSEYLSKLRAGDKYNDLKAGVVSSLQKFNSGDRMISNIKKAKRSIKQMFVPGMFFEDMGITYLGPFNGHRIDNLIRIINEAKKLDHPVIIHVNTVKGKGYVPAEQNPQKFHGISPFNPKTGESVSKKSGPTYTEVFSEALCSAADSDENIVGITAAMPDGTGLLEFEKKFPDRFFDVGIAEEHAVTFAAGLAAAGIKPFFAVYSSFLQRAYDQILHDVALQNLPVVFCIDRAGLVGNDGETHQGIFDFSFLRSIPGMTVFAPKNADELTQAVSFAASFNGPIAIRYPRGSAYLGFEDSNAEIEYGKSEVLCRESEIALIAAGNMVKTAAEIIPVLKEKGHNVTLVNARFVKPIDEALLKELTSDHRLIVTMEENVVSGGFGESVLDYINSLNTECRVLISALPDGFVEQGSQSEQQKACGIDASSVTEKILKELSTMEQL